MLPIVTEGYSSTDMAIIREIERLKSQLYDEIEIMRQRLGGRALGTITLSEKIDVLTPQKTHTIQTHVRKMRAVNLSPKVNLCVLMYTETEMIDAIQDERINLAASPSIAILSVESGRMGEYKAFTLDALDTMLRQSDESLAAARDAFKSFVLAVKSAR